MGASITSPPEAVGTDRIDAVISSMAENDVDVVAIAPSDNLTYVLGFSPLPDERLCLLLLSEHGAVFVVPALNAEQSAGHVSGLELLRWADAEGYEQALRTGLARVAPGGARRVAADPLMRADHLLALQARISGGPEYVSAESVLRELREVKSAHELELLRASALTADRAMGAALEACRPGVSELEVAAAAAAAFGAAGADRVGFTIVASGPNGALPHHHTSRRVLKEGEPVVLDLGGEREGYCSDITRMAFVGEPPAACTEVVEIVEAAVQAAIGAARPGAAAGAVDKAARDVIDSAGFGEYFVHRTGHGLGISVHEPPWITGGSEDVLRERMVFSIEPGIYLPGRFGVRLEEIVVTTSHGCEPLSRLPRAAHTSPA
jgi:Xaa-Pro aminopeptidase